MNAVVVVDKPKGPTSHDIVNNVRRWTGIRRVGHAGTLDPMATGVLVICIGATTRLSEYMLGHPKQYSATVRLGRSTDTYDAEGKVTREAHVDVSAAQLESTLDSFRGPIQQTPPPYSAIKQAGQRAHARARRGEQVVLPSREVEIAALVLRDYAPPEVMLDIHCSAGTYVRSLAHDLGLALGCGAHLAALRRTAAGPFTLAQTHTVDTLERAFAVGQAADVLLPPDAGLADWPRIEFSAEQAQRIAHGNAVLWTDLPSARLARAYDPNGQLIAIVEYDPARTLWQPRKVFVSPE